LFNYRQRESAMRSPKGRKRVFREAEKIFFAPKDCVCAVLCARPTVGRRAHDTGASRFPVADAADRREDGVSNGAAVPVVLTLGGMIVVTAC
jgi:hypothetical protein